VSVELHVRTIYSRRCMLASKHAVRHNVYPPTTVSADVLTGAGTCTTAGRDAGGVTDAVQVYPSAHAQARQMPPGAELHGDHYGRPGCEFALSPSQLGRKMIQRRASAVFGSSGDTMGVAVMIADDVTGAPPL